MTIFVVTEAGALGTGDIDSDGTMVDLAVIANDTGLGFDDPAGGQRLVTYARTLGGPVQLRLDDLVNTAFQPDYGSGPQDVDILIVSTPDDFVFGDGSFGLVNNGVALPPNGSGLPGDSLNPTVNCLVLYDTQIEICLARNGTGGTLDLRAPGPVVLYHELSHAFRICQNQLQALTAGCDPSSPEENAAIIDENDMRTQLAQLLSLPPELRDPGNHCADDCPDPGGSCCIVASLVTGSPRSASVQRLRDVRDHYLRRTPMGAQFFEQLHYDYYAFSPQVCTMIAGRAELKTLIRLGFVEPLMDFWQLVVARSRTFDPTDEEIGRLALSHFGSVDRHQTLRRVSAWWSGDGPVDAPTELLELLRGRAWPRETIQWAMVEPLRIQLEVLALIDAGEPASSIGAALQAQLAEWAPRLPITSGWGALPIAVLAQELAMCDVGLFKNEAAAATFRHRLVKEFPATSAVLNAASKGGSPWS